MKERPCLSFKRVLCLSGWSSQNFLASGKEWVIKMKDQVKVSVIIPVYRVENYLERAVDSVLAQTLRELEIILVDDGSDDTSPQICDRYAREYPDRIQVIHKENEGLGLARNTGVRAASGEYIAFLDSDDSVSAEMYESLYQKAVQDDADIVMCDVQIIYVEENKTSVSVSYPEEEIDLSDYIANGNNITYSVNKLFRKRILEENPYRKMLFEDISLIPALVTQCRKIGYVPEPFYQYYRRANTISTSLVGDMVDIVEAFRDFIRHSDPAYREEVIYNIAKQLLWNMTQSRVLFQADSAELLQEYKADFLLNPYIQKDKRVKKILEFIDKQVIPENLICVHLGRSLSPEYRQRVAADFPKAHWIEADQLPLEPDSLPECVRRALTEQKIPFAEEYAALQLLWEHGGVVLGPDRVPSLNLKRLRLNRIFFGFEDEEEITAGCFGAIAGHYVVRALLDSYEKDSVYNRALLPLQDRIRDFLMVHFQMKVNGRSQLLKHEVQVYLPSILAYDMHDGENCCKKIHPGLPDGFELVSGKMLKLWSDRLMENWNLYKKERSAKPSADGKPAPQAAAYPKDLMRREMEERVREVTETYENSTSWKITKPLRAIAERFGRGGNPS